MLVWPRRAESPKRIRRIFKPISPPGGKGVGGGKKVQLTGFGSFEVKERAERTGRNPKTNEPIVIPAGKMPVFKAGKVLKDAIK